MTDADNRLARVVELIDRANAHDPNTEPVDGQDAPKEWIYGRRMSAALEKFAPDASEALKIAARAQHIERWTSPRTDYPEGKIGYHQWRNDLKKFHAQRAGELMAEVGYDETTIARTQFLIRKEKLKSDSETQALEDVVCLVFLEFYFEPFAAQHPDDKVIDILQKTWRKMSPAGHDAALALPLSQEAKALVGRALDGMVK
ncbi:MAG: DUF4202 domain-containing protein [Deltaproteobacteria bacterium]|nr:DUF4202 domain-containing protein [Deltaproteobacteria bacterium]